MICFFKEEDPSLIHDEETVEVMNFEAVELNFRQAEEAADLMTAEEMADFMEFEYLLDDLHHMSLVQSPIKSHCFFVLFGKGYIWMIFGTGGFL